MLTAPTNNGKFSPLYIKYNFASFFLELCERLNTLTGVGVTFRGNVYIASNAASIANIAIAPNNCFVVNMHIGANNAVFANMCTI